MSNFLWVQELTLKLQKKSKLRSSADTGAVMQNGTIDSVKKLIGQLNKGLSAETGWISQQLAFF